jgi:hypothetical protein
MCILEWDFFCNIICFIIQRLIKHDILPVSLSATYVLNNFLQGRDGYKQNNCWFMTVDTVEGMDGVFPS